jgi:hypothetical protein
MLGNRKITLGSPTGAVVDRDTTVKTYLGISGSSEDTLLDLWIEAAVTQAEKYCDRFFLQRTVTETLFDECASRSLVLTHTPIASVTSIVDPDGVAVDSDDYAVDLAAGVVTYDDTGTRFLGDFTATYVAGWLEADIPASIQIGVLELIKQARNAKARDPDVVIMQSPDVGTLTFKGAIPGITSAGQGSLADIPASVQRALMPYKRRWA